MDGVPVLEALRNEEVPEHLLNILLDKERATWEALDYLIKLTPDGLSEFFGVEITDKSIPTRFKLARWKSKFVSPEETGEQQVDTEETLPPVPPTPSTDRGLTSLLATDQNAHQKAYESTSFRFLPFQNSDHDPGMIRKTDIAAYPEGCACVLYDFFSESECREIIEQGLGFGMTSVNAIGYSKSIRVCNRVSATAVDIAELIYRRVLPYIDTIEWPSSSDPPVGIDPDIRGNKYVPYGLNPCFRLVQYEPGGFFLPHFDGGYQELLEQKLSIKTLMIYLNDDFDGGCTSFFNDDQLFYDTPSLDKVIFDLKPTRGSCLLFNHQLLHDGGVVVSGEKWLLRTEVMYERS